MQCSDDTTTISFPTCFVWISNQFIVYNDQRTIKVFPCLLTHSLKMVTNLHFHKPWIYIYIYNTNVVVSNYNIQCGANLMWSNYISCWTASLQHLIVVQYCNIAYNTDWCRTLIRLTIATHISSKVSYRVSIAVSNLKKIKHITMGPPCNN